MADADPPLVRVRMPGPLGDEIVRIARIHLWRQHHDGTWRARLSWHEPSGDGQSVLIVKTDLPGGLLEPIVGQSYRMVKRQRYASGQRRGGRVATGHEWRRTG